MTIRRARALAIAGLLGCAIASGALGQGAAPAPPPCSGAEYRQFDFWLGDWDVTTPDGKPAGTNRVTRPLGDCVLQEHWKGRGGMTGESYNVYDRSSGRWHQTWVDDRGTLLLLDGGLEGDKMVLRGPERRVQGKPQLDRITWRPAGADEVHQVWEISSDQGKSWSVLFHGVYRRKK
jgi:hypothetical protein